MKNKVEDCYIEKGVDIWCKALLRPKFDNGDQSQNGSIGMALASINCQNDTDKINLIDAVEMFRKKLTEILKSERDKNKYKFSWLSVDYSPCVALTNAAEGTGITSSMFSIKSDVCICDDYVTSRFGYDDSTSYHYKMSDEWIVTKSCIHITERQEILNAILAGKIKGFVIEGS